MKRALLTGASRGLGAEIAACLLAEGVEVVAPTRGELDLSDSAAVTAYAARLGPVDVLINNAAILGPVGSLEDNPLSGWNETLTVNLIGPMTLMQAVLPGMKTRRKGKIINIAGGGATGSLPRRNAYAASKAALCRLTECVADEVREYGIDVNAVLPGPMPTDMLDRIIAAGETRLGAKEHAEHLRIRETNAGATENAAHLCTWLVSDESSGLTGRIISARFDPWPFDRPTIAAIMASDRYTLRRIDDRHAAE